MPIELLLFGLILTESLALLIMICSNKLRKLTLPGTLGRDNMYTALCTKHKDRIIEHCTKTQGENNWHKGENNWHNGENNWIMAVSIFCNNHWHYSMLRRPTSAVRHCSELTWCWNIEYWIHHKYCWGFFLRQHQVFFPNIASKLDWNVFLESKGKWPKFLLLDSG